MPDEPSRGPGRPPLPGERVPLGLRVTKETKVKLDNAARASGRSQSQEAELRLEQSFNDQKAALDALDLAYGRHWTGILLAMARAGQLTGTRGVFLSQWNFEGCEDWMSDPFAYDQVVQAVAFVLNAFRPKGAIKPPPPQLGLPALAFMRMGEDFAKETLSAIEDTTGKHANDPVVQSIQQRVADLIEHLRIGSDQPSAKPTKKSPR